jgi:hypothetical protein
MEAPTTTIQMQMGAHCIAAILAYLADSTLGPNYNRVLLLAVYLVASGRALVHNDSSRAYAAISFTGVMFARLCPSQHCFTSFFGFRLFMKHVFAPALGSIDYRPTDHGLILDIIYGPLPLMGFICTFWLSSIVFTYARVIPRFLFDDWVFICLLSILVIWNALLNSWLNKPARQRFDTTVTYICYIISRLPDALAILVTQLTDTFERADAHWARKKIADCLASAAPYQYTTLTGRSSRTTLIVPIGLW